MLSMFLTLSPTPWLCLILPSKYSRSYRNVLYLKFALFLLSDWLKPLILDPLHALLPTFHTFVD